MLYIFSEWTLNTQRYELTHAGVPVPLRPKVFQVLAYLLAHHERVVSKEELLEQVWPGQFVGDVGLNSYIMAVRKALGDRRTPYQYIRTVRGHGYHFVAEVTTEEQTPPARPAPLVLTRASTGGGPEMDVRVEGASLQRGGAASTGEWKLVTALCCALAAPPPGALLELETHYCQLSALYALTREAVQRYGGTLQPLAGEQIVAIFGVPLAQEEHAQRAVLAALELQRRAGKAGSALSAQPGPMRTVRLGLHTGHVAVGLFEETPEGAGAVVGDTLTRASALQAQAAPGTIRCSRATARLVYQVVQVAAVEPGPLAGEPPLDAVYTVLGRRTPGRLLGFQGARVLTPFIGRTRELATLHALVAHVEAGRGQVVGIIGEPGMGKTRLCYEFIQAQLAHPWYMLDTRAVSYDQAIPYGPVIHLLKDYFQLDEGDSAPVIRDQVTTQLLSLDAALTPLVPAILTLLDVPVEDPQWQALDPPQRRQQTFQAIKQLLLRASQRQPLFVVVENLHWLDTETQACLDTLVESLPTARFLLLVTYRPEYQHGWGNKTYYTQLRLDPLPDQQAHALLDAILGDEVGLQPLKQEMIALTQGNPFFLEESVQTLIETRAVDGARGAYRLGQPLPMIRVPATVQAVLATRLDRLPSEEKRLVQIAAVIGMEVPCALLQALAERSEVELRGSLAHLQAVEFLYETSFFPESAYTFKHALTHEVAYESLLQGPRRALHCRIVEVLEALYPDQRAELVERLAHHALRGEVWDKAVGYCQQAGEKALTRSAHREAMGYFEQALSALPHLPEQRDAREQALDLRLALCSALYPLGYSERILACLREAEALAATLADPHRLGQISVFLSNHFRNMGAYDQAIAAAQRSLALATASGDAVLHALANHQLGETYEAQDDYCRAIDCYRKTIAYFDEARYRERFGQVSLPAALSRALLASCYAELGMFPEGRALGDEGLRIAETVDHPGSLMWAYWGIGLLALRQGDLCKAIPRLERAMGLCQDADLSAWFPRIAATLGVAYTLGGRVVDAVSLLTQAMEQAMIAESPRARVSRSLPLGEAYLLAGHVEEAHALAKRALALFCAHQRRGHQANALRLLGEIAARREPPEVAQAEVYYCQALALAEELGMRPLQAHCHRGLGTLYAKTGQPEQACTALSAAIALYRAMDMTFWLPQTEAALAQVCAYDKTTSG
jgi:DNA-binding winged helix-turn-helix (wHTH) protein/tetratricopeptide (TPR) repeat protein/class 3 adenylate cyclase